MIPKAGLKTPLHRSDWTTARLKFLLERKRRGLRADDGVVTAFRDGKVTLRSNRREEGFTLADKEIGYQGVEEGDLVIHAMDGFAGAIGVSDSRGKCSPVYTITVPRQKAAAYTRYWAYYLRNLATTGFIESLAKGIRERSTDFRWSDAGNLLVNFPDLETQRVIANFLDRENSRIDQLIEKKQRFLQNLDRKFAATVALTLSNGLDSSVAKRSSGMAALGAIPAHWTATKLGHIGRCANGINAPGEAFGSGFPFVSYSDVYRNPALPKTVPGLIQSSVSDRQRYSILAGDIFFTRTSETIDEIGFSSVAINDIPDAVFAGFLIRFRPRKGVLAPLFSKFLFRNEALRSFFAREVMIVTRASLSQDLLRQLPLALPPLAEQERISRYLAAIESTHNLLKAKASESIDRLREFRAALITAAVTGQIDVAQWSKRGTADRQLDQIQEAMRA